MDENNHYRATVKPIRREMAGARGLKPRKDTSFLPGPAKRPLTWHGQEELFRWYSARVDKYLDAGRSDCWLARPEIADLVAGAIKFHAGDARTVEFMKIFFRNFGRSLANLIDVLDPDVVVLGGGVSNLMRSTRKASRKWQNMFSATTSRPPSSNISSAIPLASSARR